MLLKKYVLASMLALTVVAPGWAADYRVGAIEVDDLWVRASAPGQSNGAGYMDIDNDARVSDRLIAIRSIAAERVELHIMQYENGVARMRAVPGGIEVPAYSEIKLLPGGYHAMFINLKAPFIEGSMVPATLTFEKAGEVNVLFKVKSMGHHSSLSLDDHGMKH